MITSAAREEILEQLKRPHAAATGVSGVPHGRSDSYAPDQHLPLDSNVVSLHRDHDLDGEEDDGWEEVYDAEKFMARARADVGAESYYISDEEWEENVKRHRAGDKSSNNVFQQRMMELHRPTHVRVRVFELELDGTSIREAQEKGWLRRLPSAFNNPAALEHHPKDHTALDTVAFVVFRDRVDHYNLPPRPDTTSAYSSLREVQVGGENEYGLEAVWGDAEGMVEIAVKASRYCMGCLAIGHGGQKIAN